MNKKPECLWTIALITILLFACTKPDVTEDTEPIIPPTGDTTSTTVTDTAEKFSSIRFLRTEVLSEPRNWLKAVGCGSKIYFCSGSNGAYAGSDIIDIYDTLTAKWEVLKMPKRRTSELVTFYKGKLILGGGYHINTYFNDFDIYDTLTKTWSTIPYKYDHTLSAIRRVGNRIYLVNGLDGRFFSDNKVEVFDLETMSFIGELRSTVARSYITTYVKDNKLYIMGGHENQFGGKWYNLVEELNTTTNTWSSFESGYPKRQGLIQPFEDFIIGNKLAITGFYYNDSAYNETVTGDIDLLDPITKQWSVIKVKERVIGPAVLAFGNLAVIAGGYKTPYQMDCVNFLNVYNTDTKTWQTLTLSEARAYSGIIRYGSKLYVAGGMKQDYLHSNVVDIFELVK